MIAVVDYGAGNLYSVCNSLRYLGIAHAVTSDPAALDAADGVLLPGVGAFPDAMRMLHQSGMVPALRRNAVLKPLLGICLGMQVLFETGYEFEKTAGLGLIPGEVRPIEAPGLKIPHMGWNDVRVQNPCALTAGIGDGTYLYFVHSFCAVTQGEFVSLDTDYGGSIPALVHSGKVYGAQFHPEKSAEAGLRILRNFEELTK